MNILKFYVLYFSVREDLWPYSNAYVRPGTRASNNMKRDFTHVLENFLHDLQEGLQNGDPAFIGILVAVVVVILTIRKWL